jgi:hypothetical protein
MLRRAACCLVVLAALVAAPAAAADGAGPFVQQGGTGVVSSDGSTRFVAVTANNGLDTVLEAINTKDGTVRNWTNVIGSYGIPAISYVVGGADSLSHDGRLLVLSDASGNTPSDFLLYSTRNLAMKYWVTLPGHFSFDALSPDGKRMYLIQYTHASNGDYAHYIVRAYDLPANRLLPGRIADRTQKSWVMDGFPLTRVTSADGRWVYTLYQNGGNGYPFIHALDTVRGVAHCIGLPMSGQSAVYNLVLSLHGGTLAVHWRSGRPFLNVDRTTWRVSAAPTGSFPWLWTGLGAGFALVALGAAGALGLRRRRRAEELAQELDELLRLPEREVVV